MELNAIYEDGRLYFGGKVFQMNVILDVNVVLDLLLRRKEYFMDQNEIARM